ncbi:hypothetical protein ETB97_005759 [Aspergillus alliaceus]|uniref:Uncharacterized protein n=1 Tax=Petromyces alliaceus TaxID=209559 RepID=A0A8H6E3X3_PETAA|nr:hypothetical protein ETB97_005759 [Aspergillus burnettii]
MRFLLAAAIAITLCATGALSEDVKIAYFSEGEEYSQLIEPRHLTALEHPGKLKAIQSTANCLLRSNRKSRPFAIRKGYTELVPARYVEYIFCNDPPAAWHEGIWRERLREESFQHDSM